MDADAGGAGRPESTWLTGGGAMGALVRAHDWSCTPVGPIGRWPQSLRTAVGIMLSTRHPVFIFWGAEHVCLYNDAYAASLGPEKHPAILGAPGADVWPEVWPIIGPQIEQVMAGGEPTWHEDHLVPVMRHGRHEEVYWTYSYSPINDAGAPSGVGGVLVLCTETTQAVTARRASEDRFRALVEASSDVVYRMSPDWSEMRQLSGGGFLTDTPEPILDWMEKYIDPDDRPRGIAAIQEAIRTKSVFDLEHRVRRTNGSLGWTHSRAVPILDADGEIVEWFGVASDITERKRTERLQTYRLELNEQLRDLADPQAMMDAATAALGAFLQTAQVGYGEVEEAQTHVTVHRDWSDGRIPSVVGTWRINDFGPAFITEMKQGRTIVIPDVRQDPRTCAPEVVAAYDAIAIRAIIEVPLVKGGRLVALLFIHHPEPRAWTPDEVAIVEETSERLWAAVERARAEARLRESEKQLRLERELLATVIRQAPVGISLTEAPSGRSLALNDKAVELLGHGQPRTDADRFQEYRAVHADGRPYAVEDYPTTRAVRHGEVVIEEEMIYERGAGHTTRFAVSSAPIRDAGGHIVAAVTVFHDIDERLRLEEGLRHAKEEAERASVSKSKFLAAASHDLRQPMQSLLLFLDILKPHVASKGQEALKHLGRGLDALRDLLASLLDISRLDAGVVEPVIKDFAVQDLIGQIGAAYTPVAAAKGITFEVSASPAVVRSDPTLLGRMVRNLVENALRYTEAGRIGVECHEADGRLRIEVRDTGVGIPPEHLDWIWQEFHQVGNPERDRNQGLGLGLAIVQRLSSLLSHPVHVNSRPGEGSVFSIEAPLGDAAPAQPPASATEVAGSGRIAVVVDDDAIVLLGLKATFESWGYAVLAASSTDQALTKLQARGRRPDIVVADYRLRERRNGTEAVLRIRETYGADVPGIILTGETGEEVRHDAVAHRLHVVHKPVTPRQLAEALDRLLTGAGDPPR